MRLMPYYYIALGVASLLGVSTLLVEGVFTILSVFF